MRFNASSIDEYLTLIPIERKSAFEKLREKIKDTLPSGFEEVLQYDMISYVVPKSIYPKGYHCDTTLPLPFISIASQKNFIAFYHLGIYSMPELLHWFRESYSSYSKTKLDMGKSCVRFKNVNQIPYDLLSDLAKKISVKEWIDFYEETLRKK